MQSKIDESVNLIKCWGDAWGVENIVVSYSGGIDSTVLLKIARMVYPNIKAVFSNTGLEYPEIVQHVRNTENVRIIRPKKTFAKVIKDYGWPIISKKVARFVSDCKNSNPKNQKTVNLRLTGYTSSGLYAPSQKLSEKWRFLVNAPFKISDLCCHYLKKDPLESFYKKNDLHPMIGVKKVDSNRRSKIIGLHGCNMYSIKNPISYPLANWTDDDIWEFIKAEKIQYCPVYDNGEKNTGCIFCMFGIMYDKDRFIRLRKSHPELWNYVINKLGARMVLDYIKIEY